MAYYTKFLLWRVKLKIKNDQFGHEFMLFFKINNKNLLHQMYQTII